MDGETIYSLFNTNTHNHTYFKSAVDKLKSSGVKYIFIDEICRISSKVGSILQDIKKIYGFIYILVGDFSQLPSVEDNNYDVANSGVFAELDDGKIIELLVDWRAKDDARLAISSEEKNRLRNGEKPNIKSYGNKESRRSLSWTNTMRKVVNELWDMKEANTNKHIIVNGIKIYKDLPIVCKKNVKNDEHELKNNELPTVISFDSKLLQIQSKRLTTYIQYDIFKHSQFGYCITVHCSQSDTFDFEYSIHEYKYTKHQMVYTGITRSSK